MCVCIHVYVCKYAHEFRPEPVCEHPCIFPSRARSMLANAENRSSLNFAGSMRQHVAFRFNPSNFCIFAGFFSANSRLNKTLFLSPCRPFRRAEYFRNTFDANRICLRLGLAVSQQEVDSLTVFPCFLWYTFRTIMKSFEMLYRSTRIAGVVKTGAIYRVSFFSSSIWWLSDCWTKIYQKTFQLVLLRRIVKLVCYLP